MTYCDDCLHRVICGSENVGDEAMAYCCDKVGWIPVKERFPEAEYGESGSVLVCFENKTQDVLYFDGGNWCYPTGETYSSVNHKNGWHNKVISWMPLPEPYTTESGVEE